LAQLAAINGCFAARRKWSAQVAAANRWQAEFGHKRTFALTY